MFEVKSKFWRKKKYIQNVEVVTFMLTQDIQSFLEGLGGWGV